MTQLESPGVEASAKRTLSGSLGVTAIVFMVVAAASPLTVDRRRRAARHPPRQRRRLPSAVRHQRRHPAAVLGRPGRDDPAHAPSRAPSSRTSATASDARPDSRAAWIAMLTYTTIQVSVYGYIGYILSVHGLVPRRPRAAVVAVRRFVMIALVGVLGLPPHRPVVARCSACCSSPRSASSSRSSRPSCSRGGAEGLSLAPFEPANVVSGSPGVGLMFAIAAFIGFEATAIFRDEAQGPEPDHPPRHLRRCHRHRRLLHARRLGPGHGVGSEQRSSTPPPTTPARLILAHDGPATSAPSARSSSTSCSSRRCSPASCRSTTSSPATSTRWRTPACCPTGSARCTPTHLSPHVSSLVQTVTAVVLIASVRGVPASTRCCRCSPGSPVSRPSPSRSSWPSPRSR